MAGIYIHIPLCRSRCIYCGFYSTTQSGMRRRYVDALCRELSMRRGEASAGGGIGTVYIGGGTPSQLDADDLCRIFRTIDDCYGLSGCHEITLEANPDDMTAGYAQMLSTLPVNRISMGVQTFDDGMLRFLNRRHTAAQAIEAVYNCRRAGFGNVSIDLMYGLPGQSLEIWDKDLDTALHLGVEHISAYSLMYEEGTPLHRMLRDGKIRATDEDTSLAFFRLLCERLSGAGYDHYEISNFCHPGMHSRHNSSYWHGVPYIGCGAAAHSFNGSDRREWNVANMTDYVEGIETGERRFGYETLDRSTRYNEYLMTGLRTSTGIDTYIVLQRFGQQLHHYLMSMAQQYLDSGRLVADGTHMHLSEDGIFISDTIISDLMYVD